MMQSNVILLVENDKDYIYRIEQAFRKSNVRNPLRIARYGNEAILYLRGVGIYFDRRNYPLPILVILDMTNPDGSSMALLGWLREHQEYSKLPIFVLAGEQQERDLQWIFERDANVCLLRREDVSQLANSIKALDLSEADLLAKAKPPERPVENRATA